MHQSSFVPLAVNIGKTETRIVLLTYFSSHHSAEIVLERGDGLTLRETLSVVALLTNPTVGERWR